jgi:hypothetical protein
MGVSTPRRLNVVSFTLNKIQYGLYFNGWLILGAVLAGFAAYRMAWFPPTAVLISLGSALLLVHFCARFYLNVPLDDEWGLIHLVSQKAPFSFNTIWAAHNEHRIVLQRLITIGLGRLSDWNVVWESMVCTISVLAGAFLYLQRQFYGWRLDPKYRYVGLALVSLLLFHPVLSRTMISPFQMSWALMFLLFILFDRYWSRHRLDGVRSVKLGLVLLFLTLTSLHGLAGHAYVISVCVVSLFFDRRRVGKPLVGLSIWAVFLMAVYFVDFHWPAAPHGGLSVGEHILDVIYSVGVLAGNPFSNANLTLALLHAVVLAGLLGFGIMSACGEQPKIKALIGIYAKNPLMFIGLGMLLMIALGRLEHMLGYARQPLSPRYGIISIMFSAGIVAFLLTHAKSRLPVVVKPLVGLLILSHMSGYARAYHAESLIRNKALNARDCIFRHYPEVGRCPLESIFPRRDALIKALHKMEQERLGMFANDD